MCQHAAVPRRFRPRFQTSVVHPRCKVEASYRLMGKEVPAEYLQRADQEAEDPIKYLSAHPNNEEVATMSQETVQQELKERKAEQAKAPEPRPAARKVTPVRPSVRAAKPAVKPAPKPAAKPGPKAKPATKAAATKRLGSDAQRKLKQRYREGMKVKYLGRNEKFYGKLVEVIGPTKDPDYGVKVRLGDSIQSCAPNSLQIVGGGK